MASEVAVTRIGPEMHGMRMSLEEFAPAEGKPGYSYELERGVIIAERPLIPHSLVIGEIHAALGRCERGGNVKAFLRAGKGEAVLFLPGLQSERHPDISIYLTPPPSDDEMPWDVWTPDVIFEVVSASSIERDYVTKREEYLLAGVRAYCIIDPLARSALLLTRRGDIWNESHMTSDATVILPLLPGFSLLLAQVFAAVI